MPIPPHYLAAGLAWLALVAVADRLAGARRRAALRCVAGVATFAVGLAMLQRLVFGGTFALDVAKGAIAAAAFAAVLYERHRASAGRPIGARTKKAVGLGLAAAAVAAYFAGAAFSFRQGFHVWEQYHYFVGSKYFRELGYDGLYRCAAVAQDELGRVRTVGELTGMPTVIDLRGEVRRPGRLIRNLGVDNTLVPAATALADPEACRSRFSAARWEAFKGDVRFFRLAAGPEAWEQMQRDHGYNPPPGWTLAGSAVANLRSAGMAWQRALGMIDAAFLMATFGALWWAFGWRACAAGSVFWGCQAFSPYYWTGGAFLRQDWLFWLVLSVCLARRRWFALSGAALAYASLLRVFPVLLAIGWAVAAASHFARHGRLAPEHRRMAVGALAAAAVLVPLSMAAAGAGSYAAFYRHTIQLHARTQLTNNMGLPVALAHGAGAGAQPGRLEHTRDERLADPVDAWKRVREERMERMRPALWLAAALTLAWFTRVLWRVRRTWMALSLAQLWPAVLLPLTCYYYSFLLLTAPLTRARRALELPLFALAAASQAVWWAFWWNDDRYAALSLLSLVFCYGVVASFARRRRPARERVRGLPNRAAAYAAPAPASLTRA